MAVPLLSVVGPFGGVTVKLDLTELAAWSIQDSVIKHFRNRPLRKFWEDGDSRKIKQDLVKRLERRLDALEAATFLQDLNIPGFNLHKLEGKPQRYSVHVNGPWCLTFEWDGDGASEIDLENYH